MAPISENGDIVPRRPGRISGADLWRLTIAVKELLVARIRHANVPIGEILHGLRRPDPIARARIVDQVHVARLGWAIAAAARRVPWRSDCLLQAMAADRWLRRLGAAPELTIGVERTTTGGLDAHAWLRCNGVAVTGGAGGSFTPLLESADTIIQARPVPCDAQSLHPETQDSRRKA